MDSKTIRSTFIKFFEEKNHTIVPSAPLIIKNDPTLMFTNSGMNQFKDFFLGNKVAPYKRVADTQKCLRVSGKHNDLEEVGIDTYHHTMFEMLGNWSFGNYFKKEAISWAWELLTEVYKLPKDRLYVSVFGGDSSENLAFDQEAYDLWKEIISEDRIIHGSKKDNFWEMGDTGPCGPCSEIHVDLRTQEEVDRVPGKDLVNNDHPHVIEIWNLVFMQFNRLVSGKLENLPAQHVDTGMGFERLCMAIQDVKSNYDTDIFQPMIQYVASLAGARYGENNETDIAIRVIVDHIRAIGFTIADGQLPSNNKAGYVIRRILRRAVRYGYTYLNLKEPFLYKLLPLLARQFGDVFPEIKQQQEFVARVVHEEENSFLRTLDQGLKRIENMLQDAGLVAEGENSNESKARNPLFKGSQVFDLFDTYGFPKDLTLLIFKEKGVLQFLDPDWEKEFNEKLDAQKKRSRQDSNIATGDWVILREDEDLDFVGYETLEAQANIIKYREVEEKNKRHYQVILNTTPFFGESGGQVGDKGFLLVGEEKIPVINTKKENDMIVHLTTMLPSDVDMTLTGVVDKQKRQLTESNHSATHLLHAALRQVLGTHVQQKGSLVSESVLRFDFSHFAKMTAEEIRRVEHIVNQKIRENILLDEQQNVPLQEAKALGAMALFGEKYGEFVRVITFDQNYSVELCGGTHVKSTGIIGFFKIISESSVAAGVRRIEAVTADVAEHYVYQNLDALDNLKELLKQPADLKSAVETLVDERNKLQKEVEQLHLKAAGEMKNQLLASADDMNGVTVIISRLAVPSADILKKICFDIRQQTASFFLVLAAEVDSKPQIAVMASDDLVQNKGIDASKIVRELAREIKGGGGGQPFFATAGGKDVQGLEKVIAQANAMAKMNFEA